MSQVRFTRAATADLEAIAHYIRQENPKATQMITEQVYESCMALRLFPHRGRTGRVNGTRELVIGRLPYLAVYRTLEESVEILRIFHMAQRR